MPSRASLGGPWDNAPQAGVPVVGSVQFGTATGWSVVAAAKKCHGDTHVFPCKHCNRCECGKAVKDA